MKPLNVLVTGATGFVGSHLTEALAQRGYHIRCLTRPSSDLSWLKSLPVELVQADMNDHESMIPAVRGANLIFHLSGLTKAKKESAYYKANADASRVLYEVCHKVNPGVAKIVHVSSLAAAGPAVPGKPRIETDPPLPLTYYGKSKFEGERYAREYMRYLPITVISPPAVYGPREKDIYFYFKLIRRHIEPRIGLKPKYLSIVYVKDLVDAILLAADKPESTGQSYFVDDGNIYSWRDVSLTIRTVMNRKTIPVLIPQWKISVWAFLAELFMSFSSKPALINRQKILELKQEAWTCSSRKIREELGFASRYDFERGARETAQWYEENGWL